MGRFLIQILIFFLILIFFALGVFLLADGNSDSHYSNFTTPKQKSLIIGTSKAAQGLQPKIFNKILNRSDFNNFAFTVAHSPYGPVYLEAIKKKLDVTSEEGIFIITVDPYSLSSRSHDPNDINLFRENDKFLATVGRLDSKPNFQYLLKEYPYPYIYILTKKFDLIDDDYLHEDGWQEVNISMNPKSIRERKTSKLNEYRKLSGVYKFSETRLEYLEKTIEFLGKHGETYLVRLPVSKAFLHLENDVSKNFDKSIHNTSAKYNIPYLDLTKTGIDYEYTDGNHLYKSSGAKVSAEVAKWIYSIQY